jgi:hypothetical protein
MRVNGHLCCVVYDTTLKLILCFLVNSLPLFFNLSSVRCDLNRLKRKIQLSDRRLFEGLFIKTFSLACEWGSTQHRLPFFSSFCMRRDVSLSQARFGGIFFGRVGIIFVCVCLIVDFKGQKQENTTLNAARNSAELINLFENSLLLLRAFFF